MLAALADLIHHKSSDTPAGRIPTLADSFPEQWDYVTSTELFNAVMCSRRAGKTTGAVERHARVLTSPLTPRGSWTHFGSLIRRNARKHFFDPIKRRLDELGWDYHDNNTEMILRVIETDNYCQAFGCDDMSGIKAPQGDGSILFTIDECHLPVENVTKALVDVATPMLTDNGGMLDLLGLPPEVEGGFFSQVLDEGGFRVFGWTMFDHDFPRPREEKMADVVERCRRRGLKIEVIKTTGPDGRPRYTPGPGTHPLVLRQYFGRREQDPEKLAYEYCRGRNDYDPSTVDFVAGETRHSMGIDIGFGDNDAVVIQGWNPKDPERRLRVRFQWKHNHLDVDDLADVVAIVYGVYRPNVIVGDHGGHGATKVMKTIEARLHVTIQPKPKDVMISVGLMNDDYRTARLLHPTVDVETARVLAMLEEPDERTLAVLTRKGPWDGARKERIRKLLREPSDLSSEIGRVAKSLNQRTKRFEINKHGFHSDLSEANRYAHHGARHFNAKAPKPAETREERRDREWREQQRRLADPWS